MTTDTYLALHNETLQIAARCLELAAVAEANDPITAHRLRLMADMGRKVAKSTRLRIADLAMAGREGQG